MGTTMAPSYANIFLGKLEKQIIQSSPHKPHSWFRFIDDVDMKWTESEENLHHFFDHANNVQPTIKFTHETFRTNISFLDTYTTCEKWHIQQTSKQINTSTWLLFWSPLVVLWHTLCSIGPKYIFHTVVGSFLNELGYHTVFKDIFDCAI